MFAAMYADIKVVEHLLANNANVWAKLSQDQTMMHCAARNPRGAPIIHKLKQLGLNPNGLSQVRFCELLFVCMRMSEVCARVRVDLIILCFCALMLI